MRWILVAVVVVAAALDVRGALAWPLGYDETWHVYFGAIEPWSFALRELHHDSHPPLSYLLLRGLELFGKEPFWPRLASIVPALASIVLVHRIALAMGMAVPVALLGAFLLAVSHPFVNMAVCVRAYALATCFILVALLGTVRILRGDEHEQVLRRSNVWLVVAGALLATWSVYNSAFALLAMASFLAPLALAQRARARELTRALLRARHAPALTVLSTGAAGLVLWYVWTEQVWLQSYLSEFFPRAKEGVAAFAWRGARNLLDLFAPLELGRHGLGAPVLAVLLAMLGLLTWRHLRPGAPAAGAARAFVAWVVLVLPVILLVLALLGRHPFGGRLRHQLVLLPFLLLALLVLLDTVHGTLRGEGARAILVGGVGGAAVLASLHSFAGPRVDEFDWRPQWSAVLAADPEVLGRGETIHASAFELVDLYGATRERWRWRHAPASPRAPASPDYDEFVLERGGRACSVVRDNSGWTLPAKPQADWLERVAALAHERPVCVLVVSQLPGIDIPAYRAALAETARRAGLALREGPVLERAALFHLR